MMTETLKMDETPFSSALPTPEDYGAPINADDVNAFIHIIEKAFSPIEAWYRSESETDDILDLVKTQHAAYEKEAEAFRDLLKRTYIWKDEMDSAARRTKVSGDPKNDTADKTVDRIAYAQIQFAVFRANYCVQKIITSAHKATQAFKGLESHLPQVLERGENPRDIPWDELTLLKKSRRGVGPFRYQK
jgi:hypothetical protein